MTDGTSRMNTMIADLLQFSRIQSRGPPVNNMDLNQARNDALANIELTSFYMA